MAIFTINIQQNQPPLVNAGNDLIINSGQLLTLNGIVTDPDNSITSTLWETVDFNNNVIPLPPGAVITDPNSTTTTVTNLPFGEYTFRLSATDSAGETSSDSLDVTVNSSPSNLDLFYNSSLDNSQTSASINLTASDLDGVTLLRFMNPGEPNSEASYPSGTNPSITPQSATINQPYPSVVNLNSTVFNMTELGIYTFTVEYQGVGDTLSKTRTFSIVKNTSARDSLHVVQVTNCNESSSPNNSTAINYIGQTIENGTILYLGDINNNIVFNGGNNTYRGLAVSYIPNTPFIEVITTSFTFDVDSNGLVSNKVECTL